MASFPREHLWLATFAVVGAVLLLMVRYITLDSVDIGVYPYWINAQPAALQRLALELRAHPSVRQITITYQISVVKPYVPGRVEYRPQQQVLHFHEGIYANMLCSHVQPELIQYAARNGYDMHWIFNRAGQPAELACECHGSD